MPIEIANAPCSWAVYRADDPHNLPWARFLDEVSAAGYRGTELGPTGWLPEDPARLRDELGARELTLVAGSIMAPFNDPRARAETLEKTRRTCRLLGALGAQYLVVLADSPPARADVAGRSDLAPRLAAPDWAVLVDTVSTVTKIASEEHGLLAVLHPHAGSYLEFEDEIEQALAELDPKTFGICLDTGHCAYAGIDPIALYRRHAARTPYLHFKNVDGARLDRSLRDRVDLFTAVREGVFCPLDRGVVDFQALMVALDETGYAGWATVEQDSDPRAGGDPAADARESLAYLRRIGIV